MGRVLMYILAAVIILVLVVIFIKRISHRKEYNEDKGRLDD